jgi:glycerate kinase
MKIVLAPDKFKDSLTGIEFCNAVAEGIKRVNPNIEIVKIPLADGGDGTFEILNFHLQSETISTKVKDPLFREMDTCYLFAKKSKTAYVEMAKASGLNLLAKEEQNCFLTTSLGTGELIRHAIEKGATTIILGIGGSATNDCGIGMATALGFRFLDTFDKEVIPIGKNLIKIKRIDRSKVHKELDKISFKIACDVSNPLYGKNGAAFVYAPQKGANPEEIRILDQGLQNIAKLFLEQFKIDVQKIKGAGAAGGIGAAGLAFLNAELVSGIELVKDLVHFETQIQNADWIITGEGKLDQQTLSGKAISGIIDSAKKQKIPVAAFCGKIDLSIEELKSFGISYAASTIEKAKNLEDSMQNGQEYLADFGEEFMKKLRD